MDTPPIIQTGFPFKKTNVSTSSLVPNTTTNPIKFRTSLRNTVTDVMKDRGWKESTSDK